MKLPAPGFGFSMWSHISRRLAGCLLLVGCLGLGSGGLAQSADLSPAAELASFRVLDGFEVNLFASETNGVVKPSQIRFDPDGRLWVAGSASYPQVRPGEEPDDKIIVLEDTDGDGRADRTTVFASGLSMPSGLELGDGGAYVGAGTELLHLRDSDGDGRADQRRVIFRGFGTGDTHQTINSFAWGPSGELLFSQGLHARSRIETPWGLEELNQAGVWRFWPRRLRLDAFWNGAMGAHNPYGNVFDRWGQPFVFAGNGHGVYHLTPAMIRTDHFLEQRSLWNQGRKFGGGDFVENSHWPATNQNEVVTGGYLQNTVERFQITDEGGASFKVERLAPLIESTNTAFRIVDARFGPDGALYLCDWFNPVIGHYQASFRDPNRDQTHGRIWRVTAKGRPLVSWKQLGKVPTPALLNELKSPERWNRQMAKRVLADRPTTEVTNALTRWLAAGVTDEHALFEALGVYASHEVVEPVLIKRVAAAKSPEARAYAARAAGQWADRLPQPLTLLALLAADRDLRVRLEAIVACSYVPDARAVEVAAIATDRPMDPALDYAFTQCVHALKPLWQPVQAKGGLTFEGRPGRQTAFAKAAGDASAAQFAAGRLRRVAEVALDEPTICQLTETIAENGGTNELLALLPVRGFTVGTNYHADLHGAALALAARASRSRGLLAGNAAADPLAPLLDSPVPAIQAGALQLVGLWRVDSLRVRLSGFATNAPTPPAVRPSAWVGVAGFGDDEARRLLTAAAGGDFWGNVADAVQRRSDAATALVRLDLPAAASAAGALFAGPLDATSLRNLTSALIQQRSGSAALKIALSAVQPTAANARAILALLAGDGRREAELASVLTRAAGGTVVSDHVSAADIPALAAAVRAAGNSPRGAEIFKRSDLACTTCHALDGTPGKIGPSLGALGTAQTVEFILGAILDPQKEVKEGFMAHEIVAQDGTTYQGYLRGEAAEAVTLFDHLSGQTVKVARNQIAERRQLGSLMPDGLASNLSRDELRDLVKFLAQLGRQ
jgi:putative heme-binding domain-containing protein